MYRTSIGIVCKSLKKNYFGSMNEKYQRKKCALYILRKQKAELSCCSGWPVIYMYEYALRTVYITNKYTNSGS